MASFRRGKPKTTVDSQFPGAFEGETVTRRRMMVGSVHLFGGIAAAAIALPSLGFALGPVFRRQEARWEAVGEPGDFPDDTYAPKVITLEPDIGEAGKSTVYVRRYNPDIDTEPRDEFNEHIAISTRCAHLGCPVRYIEASESFICPCHGGVYDQEGKRTGGPPVRPLDRFYTRVREGQVEVGPRFSVNSELERFSPRYPGEPLDGIGQYLYPARFTTAKP